MKRCGVSCDISNPFQLFPTRFQRNSKNIPKWFFRAGPSRPERRQRDLAMKYATTARTMPTIIRIGTTAIMELIASWFSMP